MNPLIPAPLDLDPGYVPGRMVLIVDPKANRLACGAGCCTATAGSTGFLRAFLGWMCLPSIWRALPFESTRH